MSIERGYLIDKDRLLQRLARIKGQVEGISGMVEEDRYCIDVVTQIGAVQGAIDRIALGLLDGTLAHCLLGEGEGATEPDAQADELMGAGENVAMASLQVPVTASREGSGLWDP